MTDKEDDIKQKKLTLGTTRLTLKPSVTGDIGDRLQKNFINHRSNTVVEIKKTIHTGQSLSLNRQSDRNDTSDDFSRRLALVKKASEESKPNDATKSTLTKLAILNRSTVSSHVADDLPTAAQSSEQFPLSDVKQHDMPVVAPQEIEQIDKKPPPKLPLDNLAEVEKIVDNKIVAKAKLEEPKKLKKTDIINLLDADESDIPIKTRSLASIKRARDKEKRKLTPQKQEKIYREVIIPETIEVSDLANRMSERVADVVRELMKLGIMANPSCVIDADTAELVVSTLGHSFQRVQESDIENILIAEADKDGELRSRPPVVSIMGHVDHGKTSLLDALKSTDVVASEVGGITQHIGAYVVHLQDGRSITFIDTPGHEAFSEMRIRGAKITDIVILVVAADDGIKAQTVEAINHAQAAGVPIIVAINKIDKPNTDITRIKHELLAHNLVSEEFGGDVMMVEISALKKINLDKLEEAILLLAEMGQLTANISAPASGVIIEAKIDKAQGIIATALVQRGTLRIGDIIVAGDTSGRIRKMNDDKKQEVAIAMPGTPVEIYGLNEAPKAGDMFNVLKYEKQARDIAEYRARITKDKKASISTATSLEDLFSRASGSSTTKDLPIILKGDVQGSIEAIVQSLRKLPCNEIKIQILHQAVGAITESDVILAAATKAMIISFNVRPNNNARIIAEREKVDIRYYSIIYNLLDDVKAIMSGMLSPIIREQYIGTVEIRQIFNITKVGKIAGSYVTNGIIKKGASVRLLRDNVVLHEGKLKTLKRFKDEVKEVRENFECGIAFEKYEDIREGDVVEVFEIVQEKRQLS